MGKSKPVKNHLLLLDLDGVMVVGQSGAKGLKEDLRFLHPELPPLLVDHNIEVIIFTHRAYADAQHIKCALENLGLPIIQCVSAREMMLSALMQLRFVDILTGGLSKKFGLAYVLKHYTIEPSQLTLIDDRPEILTEVAKEGVGLALQAPFTLKGDQVTTFDSFQMLQFVGKNREPRPEIVQLNPVIQSLVNLPIITVIEGNRATTTSLLLRSWFRRTRQWLKKYRG